MAIEVLWYVLPLHAKPRLATPPPPHTKEVPKSYILKAMYKIHLHKVT